MAKGLNNELLKEISGGGYDAEGILRLDELTRRYKSQGLSKEETVKQLFTAANMAFEIPGLIVIGPSMMLISSKHTLINLETN